MASMLAVTPMITGVPQLSSPADKPHPVKSQTRQVGFAPSSVAAMRADKEATPSAPGEAGEPDPMASARSGAETAVQTVSSAVTVVGVTWPKGAVTTKDHFQIRTLTGTTWGEWTSLHLDQADGPDAKEAATATRGSSPYVVTGASKYELRSLSSDPSAPLDAKVQVVNPGTSGADNIQAAPGGAAAATAKPTVYSRATWGANESLRKGAPSYGKIELAFVHHTDSANTYTAADVPAMIRGMYAYHVQSLGWSDIGYNFLVDRFGRTWEGRFGGMDKPVVGAQTMNYNSVSTGVSAIGNFETTGVPAAMTASFKRILAWKLSLAGVPAIGNVPAPRPPSWSTATYFQRISGHRAGFQTACPGQYLVAKLPEIRVGAAALIAAAPPPPPPPVVIAPPVVAVPPAVRSVINRDVDRNGALDVLSYKPGLPGRPIVGSTSLLASASRTPVTSGRAIGSGWNGMRNASVSKDVTGDGRADIIAQDVAANALRIYRGNGRGGFAGTYTLGRGWNGMNRLLAAGDRDKDGRNDILSTNPAGDLMLYPGTGTGSVRPGRVIGRGWTTLRSITSAGDLTGDGKLDILATRISDGVQLMYAGTSTGSLRSGLAWRSGMGAFSTVVGGSDLDGDRYPDVYARLGRGMTTQSSDASGRLVRSIRWGNGWDTYNQLSTGADWNGDRVADLLAVNPALNAGTMTLFPGTGKRDFATRVAAFPTIAGADLVKLVGDVNGDGYADAVARVRTSNTLVLLRGMAGSRFAAPVRIGSGWNALTLIEAAGDYNADGIPDLLTRDPAGALNVYPFTRSGTFKPRLPVGAGFQGMASVIGTGPLNQDNFGDVVSLRASDHALVLHRGTGSSGLVSPGIMKAAQNDLAQLLGAGDYNGDGNADVMARSTSGAVWLYPGNGTGGLSAREPVRGGQGAGYVLG